MSNWAVRMSLRWSVSKLVLLKRQRLTVVHVLEESEALGVRGGGLPGLKVRWPAGPPEPGVQLLHQDVQHIEG